MLFSENTLAIRREWLDSAGSIPAESFFMTVARPDTNPPEVKNGILHIYVRGPISNRPNAMSRYYGGTATEKLTEAVTAAVGDDSITGVLVHIDSPGGAVNGSAQFAEALYQARQSMPVVAYIDGMAASGGYWIASAADRIIATDAALVGSIGVITTHVDVSEAEKMSGIRRTPISAGRLKKYTSSSTPLDMEGYQALQEEVNATYEIFVDRVARNRGVSVETVLSDMADAREFIGQRAVDAGLVDAIGTLNDALRFLNVQKSGVSGSGSEYKFMAGLSAGQKGVLGMDVKEILSSLEQRMTALDERLERLSGQGQEGHGAGLTPPGQTPEPTAAPVDFRSAVNQEVSRQVKGLVDRIKHTSEAAAVVGLTDVNDVMSVALDSSDGFEVAAKITKLAAERNGGALAGIGDGGKNGLDENSEAMKAAIAEWAGMKGVAK